MATSNTDFATSTAIVVEFIGRLLSKAPWTQGDFGTRCRSSRGRSPFHQCSGRRFAPPLMLSVRRICGLSTAIVIGLGYPDRAAECSQGGADVGGQRQTEGP